MASATKFLGNTVSEAAAFAAGSALREPLIPLLQALTNETWAKLPTLPLEAGDAAELAAQGIWTPSLAQAEAVLTGISNKRFAAVLAGAMIAPDYDEAIDLWRRGKISEADVDTALAKAKLLPQYRDAVKELYNGRLQPAVIALAIVRGIMADPGFLPVGPPAATGKIAAFPTSDLDPLEEAIVAGIDKDRLFVETAIAGRPMSPEEAASAAFRGIIDRVDFDRAIAEGDTRNEWADAIYEHSRQIVSAEQYVQLRLRGWTDDAGLYTGAALHGMSQGDADRLLLIHGRPLSWHQVWIGLQRGGVYDGPTDDIDPAFLKALQESDIRPEWYNLAWAQRYSYPSAFVLKALAAAGDITEADTVQVLKYEGWEPTFAAKAAAAWTGGTKTVAAPEIKSAKTKLLTKLHTLYVSGQATDAQALEALTAEKYSQAVIDGLLATWDNERALIQSVGMGPPTGPIT